MQTNKQKQKQKTETEKSIYEQNETKIRMKYYEGSHTCKYKWKTE